MAQHCGYVIEVKNLRKHPNADRLQLLDVFGTTTTVGLDVKVGDIGIYFPTDLQLSVEYCAVNHLCRKNPKDGTIDTGYMDADKRNVSAIRLRGEKSDGLYVPISTLETFGNVSKVKVGDTIDIFNGVEICCKYIPRSNKVAASGPKDLKAGKKKKIAPIAPLFSEHIDTSQLAYNLSVFKPGDEIEITLKMHGTSQRTGYLPVLKGYRRTLLDRILRRPGTPIYDWGYISGTRRTILGNYDGGFYGSNEFREQHSKIFEGKLWKGETVYYEVVGFTHTGTPIMGDADNKKLNDKEFIKQYGETTRFSYGCEPNPKNLVVADPNANEVVGVKFPLAPQSDIYVYRMTMTNEDGDTIDYTPDFMRYRCEQMGVKTVPVFAKAILNEESRFVINDVSTEPGDLGAYVLKMAEFFCDGPDPVGKTHVREGAVVRIINRPKFTAYKHKNFSFKVLEGIIKDAAAAPDMEEAQETINESI